MDYLYIAAVHALYLWSKGRTDSQSGVETHFIPINEEFGVRLTHCFRVDRIRKYAETQHYLHLLGLAPAVMSDVFQYTTQWGGNAYWYISQRAESELYKVIDVTAYRRASQMCEMVLGIPFEQDLDGGFDNEDAWYDLAEELAGQYCPLIGAKQKLIAKLKKLRQEEKINYAADFHDGNFMKLRDSVVIVDMGCVCY